MTNFMCILIQPTMNCSFELEVKVWAAFNYN